MLFKGIYFNKYSLKVQHLTEYKKHLTEYKTSACKYKIPEVHKYCSSPFTVEIDGNTLLDFNMGRIRPSLSI